MNMKVTGNSLQSAISTHSLRADTAAKAFDGTLRAFDDEKKQTPQEVIATFLKAEESIARLQVAQMRFNLTQRVHVAGLGEMCLAQAIKLVGSAGRVQKKWKSATEPKRDRYSSHYDDERDPSKVVSKPTVTTDEAMRLAIKASKRSSALRAAIAKANLQEMEIEDLDESLFE